MRSHRNKVLEKKKQAMMEESDAWGHKSHDDNNINSDSEK